MVREPDFLPISMLNQLCYCERRFWLMYVQGEMVVNAPVLEGIQQHERAHTGGSERKGDVRIYRRVYVWSDRLRISGFADVVEERDEVLLPVEYKHGRMGRWLNDHIQLCAQAICLEEQTGTTVPEGAIFYWRSRRRVSVDITPELRMETRATIERARVLLAQGQIPDPIENRRKCHDCSLEEICLPRELDMLLKR